MFVKILEYKVFKGTKKQVLDLILKKCTENKVHIVSGNPEVLYNGLNNKILFSNFTDENSIIIPDGVGVVKAAKLAKQPVTEKIPGIEVMGELIEILQKEGKSIYLLGATKDILNECIINLKLKYPNLNIIGFHNGYFDLDNCNEIIEDIKLKKPYALFVAMGCPRQEIFIAKYIEQLPCNIFMGVGGSFDVYAGKVKRAPKWMIKLGIEWVYRVVKEPYRIKRLGNIPKFLLKVVLYKPIIK